MTEKTYSATEAKALAIEAAQVALAQRPVPTHVSVKQAAEMLGLSCRTIARLKLPRNAAGRIPYEGLTMPDVPHGTLPRCARNGTPLSIARPGRPRAAPQRTPADHGSGAACRRPRRLGRRGLARCQDLVQLPAKVPRFR